MSRVASMNQMLFHNDEQSGAGTKTWYLAVPYDILVKGVHVLGINPASTDGDTVRVVVDYASAGAASFTTIADTTADEYNDTDDTASLGAATTRDIRAVGAADWGTLTFPGTRVPGNSYIRVREIWAGTVGDGEIATIVSWVVLNDGDDSD